MLSINCKGHLVDFEQTKIMGVINLSPQSFYVGSVHEGIDNILSAVAKMINEGADIIDFGGQSTKPGSPIIDCKTELELVLPVIKIVNKKYPNMLFSVDTFYGEVALQCIENGVTMVNDISGGMIDNSIIDVVCKHNIPYVLSHIISTPYDMQTKITDNDIVLEELDYFRQKIELFKSKNFYNLILDVGIGFGKSVAQNIQLIKNLNLFKMFNMPLLIGVSRKSFIYKTLNVSAKEALNGTTIFNFLSLSKGANMLRVHDVKEAKECVKIFNAVYEQ